MIHDAADSSNLERRRGRPPGILRWVLVLSLCAILIFAVLAFGAVDEWSTFTFEAGCGSPVPRLGGKATCFQATEAIQESAVLANHPVFRAHSRADCAALGLRTVTSPNTKHCSMSHTAFFC